ncbi:sms: DNA repair protein RadA [Rubrobacter radiotolerans]|uniref:DNA repair protein RadA n=1 Tax=Rubrobacter radiotolerans TaxID=42256 RepID=A0A023X4H3_RUBRA|nr:DNA repair protein RadA [Rubrobacter radiotolerans]AHY47248.1 sms: DNA repair protein RadA [Rubrobacter radiotolerans]MDX5894652.1 DNA repair protein RadA [Rubrobacter radiotolerans]SMC06476.1 DNA repair protein RadA/Sms [Rubrobacter radiotolerans DSM 5868]
MAVKTMYVCSNCGHEERKWLGRCPDCGEWSTFVEEAREEKKASSGFAGRVARGPGRRGAPKKTLALSEVPRTDSGGRIESGIGELDRILGGGIVPGSMVLVGGEPGVGKSTLLLQVMGRLGGACLMVSGEESPRQVAMSARRLGVAESGFRVLSETDLDVIEATVLEERPEVVVVDSIQTLYSPELTGAPGGVGQVRECAARLMRLAKSEGIAVVLVGHVTKDGSIAGPRVLEHMVDTVLQFEGDRFQAFRVLRALKNRFGSTNEIGVFEMTGGGMEEVEDPSAFFLSRREGEMPSGVVTVCLLEGTRPMLVEIESLVAPSPLAMPRRVANGLDNGRVNMLCAVLSRRAGLNLSDQDVYVNVTGGVRVEEPAADLGVALAVASALRDRPVGKGSACFGEVGLTGDIRFVPGAERRLGELLKMGFDRIIGPEKPERQKNTKKSRRRRSPSGGPGEESLLEVKTLEEAVAVALL